MKYLIQFKHLFILPLFLFLLLPFTKQAEAQDVESFTFISPFDNFHSRFGDKLAVDGDYAVAIGASNGRDLFFYFFNGSDWEEITEINVESTPSSVAMDGDLVVVGFQSGSGIGAYQAGLIRIYRLKNKDNNDRTWEFEKELFSNSPNSDGRFGYTVDVKNGTIAVGETRGAAEDDFYIDTGSVHLFNYENDKWVRKQRFYAPDEPYDTNFGRSLSFNEDGSELAVTSLIEDDGVYNAYHYQKNSAGTWVQNATLSYSYVGKGRANSNKMPVSFHGDLIAIGTSQMSRGSSERVGSVQFFSRSGSGWSGPTEFVKPGDYAQADNFGLQVQLYDGYMAVAAPGYNSDKGAVFVYEKNGSDWDEIIQIDNPTNQSGSYFGNTFSFDESGRLFSAAPTYETNGNEVGRAYMHFVFPPLPQELTVSNGTQQTSINLAWKRAVGQDGYRIYEKGNPEVLEIIENGSANSFSLNDLNAGTAKELGISSYNEVTESPVVWGMGYSRPNGTISGNVTSQGGGGMPEALLKAEPYTGKMAYFNGNGFFEVPHNNNLNTGNTFSIEAVIRPGGDLSSNRYAVYSTRSDNEAGSFQLEIGNGSGGSGRVAVTSVNTWVVESPDNTIQPDTYHHIAYVRDGDQHKLYVDGEEVADRTNTFQFADNESPKLLGAGLSYGHEFEGQLGEIRLWDEARSQEQIGNFQSVLLDGTESNLSAYWRLAGELESGAIDWKIASSGSPGGSDGIGTDISFEASDADLSWGSYTDNQGDYSIRSVIYDAGGSDFTVTPSFGVNEYDPETRDVTLDPTQSTDSQVSFTDITTFTVSGKIEFEGTNSCVAANVDIYVNDVLAGQTDEEGNYTVAILQSGQNEIRPEFQQHEFEPAQQSVNVISDMDGINFSNVQRYTLDGQVAGGDCRFSLGQSDISINGGGGCFTEEITTDDAGNYEIDLPALPDFFVEVDVSANQEDDDIIFQTRDVNLSDTSRTEDFLYRTAPQISITGLPDESSCGTRVLSQLDSYSLEIEAYEEYNAGVCPVDEGVVLVNNQIADQSEIDTLSINNGIAGYDFTAGFPNIVGGGNNPYQKQLEMEVITGNADSEFSFNEVFAEWAVVDGHRPREQTFTTVSPEIPFFILRDPPGDQSYSLLSEEQSICRTMNMSALSGTGSTAWMEGKVGTKFESGLGVSVETEVWASINTSLSVSATIISQEEIETCLISNQEFSTSDTDNFTGEDGDLYVGAAMNILYALTDVLEYNETACRVDLSKDIVFGNDGFETTYVYTEDHIKNFLIPDLNVIRNVPTLSPDSVAYISNQIDVWNQTLDMNSEIKEMVQDSEPIENYSISGGAGVSYSETSTVSESRTIEFDVEMESEIATEAGFEIGGSGLSGGASVRMQTGMGEARTVAKSQSNTLGFFLGDDDSGDSFSVDVKSDPVFGTFVFDLAAGTSSCPWEPGTLPRDGVQLNADELTKINVPADHAVPFQLNLGNTGQSNETRKYRLNTIPGSNPDGAVLLVNGISLNDLEPFDIPDLASFNQTLTIQRGPTVFDYENLGIVMQSVCDPAIADTVSLTVRFESSCSPMDLEQPDDGWIVNSGSSNTLPFSIGGYDKTALNNILLQYSPGDDNSWNTAQLISSDDLPDNSANLEWDVSELEDGDYSFRIAVQCDAGITYTPSVSGSIQRSGLMVTGEPQPGDEILNIGDEISITFNRQINRSSVMEENVQLTDVSNGEKIASSFTVSGATIHISPDEDGAAIQNRLLRSTVADIKDESGNLLEKPVSWQFRVRQNPLTWNSLRISENVLLGDETTLTGTLVNHGAEEEAFSLVNIPDWLDATVTSGSVDPDDEVTIAFTPDLLLGPGLYRDTVKAETSQGNENLIVEYGIQCEPPAWAVDEASFDYSMNLIASFYVDDVPFSNENDIVAAFAGDEIRGVTRVVPLVPDDPSATGYEYAGFVTLFSNQSSGETLSFQVWDAAACRVMDVTDTITFESNAMIGSAEAPEKFKISGAMLQSTPIDKGNNWISLGVEATNMSVDNVLSRINPREGDAIIGQSAYSQFVMGSGWVGTLDSLDPGIMYHVNLNNESTLELIGDPVDGEDRPIEISSGWNWLGYLPAEELPLEDALATLTHKSGDIIRNRTSFSQYNDEDTWVGNLSSLRPGDGYKLFRSDNGVLTYPGAEEGVPIAPQMKLTENGPDWTVNAADFEHVMTATGSLTLSGELVTGESAVLSAWLDGELRGVARPVNVMDQWLYFLNIYGEADEQETEIYFKAWDPEAGLYEDLDNALQFDPESVHGTPRKPIEWFGEMSTSADDLTNDIPESFDLNQNYPNPFNPTTNIKFALPEASDVRIDVYNILGQRVATLVNEHRRAGFYNLEFDASRLASGAYFYRIRAGSFVKTQKMMLIK